MTIKKNYFLITQVLLVILVLVFSVSSTGPSNDELILCSYNTNIVNILDFQGGQFVGIGNLTTLDLPQTVAAGDINNDGKMEIAVVSEYSVLELFKENGGIWEKYYTDYCSHSYDYPYHLEIGNIDDDVYLEVVYACTGPGGELVAIEDNGVDVTREVITTIDWATHYDLDIGNLDNDNYNEVFITDETNDQVRVYEFNGVGYDLVSTFPYPDPMFVMDNMDVGDMNGDGIEDLIACGNSQRVHIFAYENGAYHEKWTSEWLLGMTEACSIGDYDGDGSNEIAVSAAIGNSPDYLHYYDKLNSDPTNYTFINLWQYEMTSAPFLDAMDAGDFDADSVEELGFDEVGQAKYWDNNSIGPPFEVIDILGVSAFCFESADIDMDSGSGFSDDEILIASSTDLVLRVFDYNGSDLINTFNVTTPYTFDEADAGDIDGDGESEIVIVDDSDNVRFFKNMSGTWTEYYNYSCTPTGTIYTLLVANVDDDDTLEVVFACRGDELVVFNNESGTVTPTVVESYTWASSYAITVANVDGDDYAEIFLPDNDNNLIHVYEYNGSDYLNTVNFSYPTGLTTMDMAEHGDADGDGTEEIILCGNSNKVHIVNASGDNSYSYVWNSSDLGGFTENCGIGDFNGDNKNDIIATVGIDDINDYHAFFEKNNSDIGDYVFINTWNFSAGQSPTIGSSGVGDYDADGRDEWIYRKGTAGKYWNNDTSPYGPPFTEYDLIGIPVWVVGTGDVDNDGGSGRVCGDGVKDPVEQCDGSDLGGKTCESLGFLGGNLSCDADCRFDTINCIPDPCGDGYCDGDIGEDCNTCLDDCIGGSVPEATCSACHRGRCDGSCNTRKEGSDCYDCNTNEIAYCCGDSVCNGLEDVFNCLYDCAECEIDLDCADGETCTTDTCNAGVCENTWPDCGLSDGCCGLGCDSSDPDCPQGSCDACWKGECDGSCHPVKEGPDCPDCQ